MKVTYIEKSLEVIIMQHLELFVIPWGVYPRRVLIYLHEKGLLNSGFIKITPVTISPDLEMVAPGKPKGTVPILALPDGIFIKQSVPILEYLEDICDNPQKDWQKEIAATAKSSSMRGNTSCQRATTREMLALADEVTAMFGFACHKGSKLFVTLEPTNPVASSLAMDWAKRNLTLFEAYYEGRFEEGYSAEEVTIADCALFSLLQFAKELYGRHLVVEEPGLPNLKRFYDAFKERESTKILDDFYPKDVRDLARVWLQG
ncbi:hypothetical protein F4820DRAFT_313083 [Hypoxylon rubiginosum]|uniref:Uncharacterized protein n=1 Tax=Hypoxylon rubiginosum TaxID=110542 RepID=A0ACB9Z0L7_9PEZI|nr:hypothetical protein F4820DRAFT_313083 [Hypoxylon rubiginosum]